MDTNEVIPALLMPQSPPFDIQRTPQDLDAELKPGTAITRAPSKKELQEHAESLLVELDNMCSDNRSACVQMRTMEFIRSLTTV